MHVCRASEGALAASRFLRRLTLKEAVFTVTCQVHEYVGSTAEDLVMLQSTFLCRSADQIAGLVSAWLRYVCLVPESPSDVL